MKKFSVSWLTIISILLIVAAIFFAGWTGFFWLVVGLVWAIVAILWLGSND